jgi:UDP-N-acetylmuramate--alanine ligase
VKVDGLTSSFRVIHESKDIGEIVLPAPGMHNVLNALATVVVALEVEIPFDKIKGGLEKYSGIRRRFQMKGKIKDIIVLDDYGHHPTEVRATLAAARSAYGYPASGGRRIVAVFQPHRYSRTKDLHHEFMDAFDDADVLILTEIYAAGEEPIAGVTGELLYREVKEGGHKNVIYIPDRRDIAAVLRGLIKDKDLVITLGAGDVYKVGEDFLREAGK